MYFMSEFYIKGAALQGKSASQLAAFHYVVYFTDVGELADFFEGWQVRSDKNKIGLLEPLIEAKSVHVHTF